MKYKILYAILTISFCIIAIEFGFRIYLNLTGKDVITVWQPEEVLKKAWFKPHPSLLYVFKPNSRFILNSFGGHNFTINKYGFRSTLEYDPKDVTKPADTIRIATFGGSTTMGVNENDEIWPYLAGKILSQKFTDKHFEVLNEGIMGYSSLENLLDLALRVIDYDCDIYIIYLGVNDELAKSPLSIYKSDYSHFRKTFYESLYSSPAQLLPPFLFKLKSVRSVLQSIGIRDSRDLVSTTGTAQFRNRFNMEKHDDSLIESKMRQTVIRNVKSMIGIIRAHRPDAMIVLSSFYDLKNRRFLNDLNEDFKKLSIQMNVIFVDPANNIPKESSMAYDYGHFTPEGDYLMAKLFADSIANNLASDTHSTGH